MRMSCLWKRSLMYVRSENIYRAIIRRRSDDTIVEWIPFQIENLAGMSNHFVALEIDAAGL